MWKKFFREREIWLLIFLGILYFFQPLFRGEAFFFRDLNNYFLPQKQLLTDFFQVGELPLWDPYLHGGQGYLTNIANAACYPLNLLYLFLPLLIAFNITIVGHVIGCAACAYLCARTMGLRPVSSLIVGAIYGFCGYSLSLINLLNFLIAMPYLPLIFSCWHRYLLERQRKWFVLAVVFGGVQVLPGAPEVNVITLLLLGGWTFFYTYTQSKFRLSVALLMLGCGIIGITAFQLLPTFEIVRQSIRGQRMESGYVSPWSLPPQRLPEFMLPNFFGYIDTMPVDDYYWGASISAEAPYIVSLYVGVVTIALMCIAGFDPHPHGVLSIRARRYLFISSIIALLCAFGRYWPFFETVYQHVPLLSIFRYPIKFLIAGIFPCALLAGYASERCFGRPAAAVSTRVRSNAALLLMIGGAVALVAWTVLFENSSDLANWFQRWSFKQPGSKMMRDGLTHSFKHAAMMWAVFTLLCYARHLQYRWWQHWLLAGMILVDLLVAGRRINPTAPEAFYAPPPIVSAIQREIGDGRLFQSPLPESVPILASTNHVMWRYHLNFEQLEPYSAAFFRIPVIFHLNLLLIAPRPLAELTEEIKQLPWPQRLPILSAGNVRLIITSEQIADHRVERLAEIPTRAEMPLYLYRNTAAAARVEFITSWKSAASFSETLALMKSSAFDPRKEVILQKAVSESLPERSAANSNCAPASIRTLSENTHRAQYALSAGCSGYVVFSEPLYPGWHIHVDGKPTPILRANYAFSAIFLQAGDHRIERYYRPDSFLLGGMISLFSCGVLLIGYRKNQKYSPD